MGIGYSDGTTPNVVYSLDRLGRRTTIQKVGTGGSTSTVFYSEGSLPLSEVHTAGPLSGVTLTNSLDAFLRRGKLLLLTNNTSAITNLFSYDAASRLKALTNGAHSANYSFFANSALIQQLVLRQNVSTRLTVANQYDALNRLLDVSSTTVSNALINARYRSNDANQRTRVWQADGSYWAYDYDALGQVTSGKKYWNDGTPVAGQQFEYAFDDIGNRTSTQEGGDAQGFGLRSATYGANTVNPYTNRTVSGTVDVAGICKGNRALPVSVTLRLYRAGNG